MLEHDFYAYAEKRIRAVGPAEPPSWYLRCRTGHDKSRATVSGESGRDIPPEATAEDIRKLADDLIEANLQRERIHIELVPSKGTRGVASFHVDPDGDTTAPATKEDLLGAIIETMRIQRATINDQGLHINRMHGALLKAAEEQGIVKGFMMAGEAADPPRVDPAMAREAMAMVKELFGGQVKTPRDALKKMDELVTALADVKKSGGGKLSEDEQRQGAALIERVLHLVHGEDAMKEEPPAAGSTDAPQSAAGGAS